MNNVIHDHSHPSSRHQFTGNSLTKMSSNLRGNEDSKRPDSAKKDSASKPKLRSVGDWSEHMSSSGKKYYYNFKSEVSQWEKPPVWLDWERKQSAEKRKHGSQAHSNQHSSSYHRSTSNQNPHAPHSVDGPTPDGSSSSSRIKTQPHGSREGYLIDLTAPSTTAATLAARVDSSMSTANKSTIPPADLGRGHGGNPSTIPFAAGASRDRYYDQQPYPASNYHHQHGSNSNLIVLNDDGHPADMVELNPPLTSSMISVQNHNQFSRHQIDDFDSDHHRGMINHHYDHEGSYPNDDQRRYYQQGADFEPIPKKMRYNPDLDTEGEYSRDRPSSTSASELDLERLPQLLVEIAEKHNVDLSHPDAVEQLKAHLKAALAREHNVDKTPDIQQPRSEGLTSSSLEAFTAQMSLQTQNQMGHLVEQSPCSSRNGFPSDADPLNRTLGAGGEPISGLPAGPGPIEALVVDHSTMEVTLDGNDPNAGNSMLHQDEPVQPPRHRSPSPLPPVTNLSLSLNNHFRTDLITHVSGWPGDLFERQARRIADDAHNNCLSCAQTSADLKCARSLVRVAEIRATLLEQRVMFMRQQYSQLDKVKPSSLS